LLLRLATNYFPPENYLNHFREIDYRETGGSDCWSAIESQSADLKLKLRQEWDWKGAEREIRRANELKADYPAAHQWSVAHFRAKELAREIKEQSVEEHLAKQLSFGATVRLTPNERAIPGMRSSFD
jgi:hypothetical protein